MPLPPGTSLGPYVLLTPLGSGGMGEVYKARDGRLNRLVAVKLLAAHLREDARVLARFQREARILAGLKHPGIVAIHDVGEIEGVPYLVTELLEGETLAARLARGRVPLAQALSWTRSMAQALAAAHGRGVIHRDLKPANVMIGKGDAVKLLDFGLARDLNLDLDSATGAATLQGTLLGTVGYMAPEQVRGEAADARSDLFALGVLLLEMLTGRQAFRGDSAVEVLHAILREDPLTGVEVPESLRPLLIRLLAKEPEERFQTASDLAFALGAPALPPKAGARRRWPWLIGASLLTVMATTGTWAALRHRTPPPLPTFQRVTADIGAVQSARFSPDGRMVAYSAEDDDGRLRIWTLQEGHSHPIDTGQFGTVTAVDKEGGCYFLDSEYTGNIGAGIGGNLFRWINAGTTPTPIAEKVMGMDLHPVGGSMALVTCAETGRQIQSTVSIPGGRELYRSNLWIRCPRYSPMGDRLAFLESTRGNGWEARIVVVDLEGRERWRSTMVRAAQIAWEGEDGFLFTGVDRSMFVPRRMTLSGHITECTSTPISLFLLDRDRRGRLLTYAQSTLTDLVQVEGEGRWRPLTVPPGGLYLPNPEGDLLGFIREEAWGGRGGYVFDRSTGRTTRLSGNWIVCGWSTRRRWMCLGDFSADASHWQLGLMAPQGGPIQLLDTRGLGDPMSTLTVSEGGRVFIQVRGDTGRNQMMLLEPGSAPRELLGLPAETWAVMPVTEDRWVAGSLKGVHQRIGQGPDRWEPIPLLADKAPLGWDPDSGDLFVTELDSWPATELLGPGQSRLFARPLRRWRYAFATGRLSPMPDLPGLSPTGLYFVSLSGPTIPGKTVSSVFRRSGSLQLVEGLVRP